MPQTKQIGLITGISRHKIPSAPQKNSRKMVQWAKDQVNQSSSDGFSMAEVFEETDAERRARVQTSKDMVRGVLRATLVCLPFVAATAYFVLWAGESIGIAIAVVLCVLGVPLVVLVASYLLGLAPTTIVITDEVFHLNNKMGSHRTRWKHVRSVEVRPLSEMGLAHEVILHPRFPFTMVRFRLSDSPQSKRIIELIGQHAKTVDHS